MCVCVQVGQIMLTLPNGEQQVLSQPHQHSEATSSTETVTQPFCCLPCPTFLPACSVFQGWPAGSAAAVYWLRMPVVLDHVLPHW
jgi:hypothetical protein